MRDELTRQDMLVVFDFDATDEEPYLSVRELQSGLLEHRDVAADRETIRGLLSEMKFDDRAAVCRKRGDEWVWRATVAPRLNSEFAAELDRRAAEMESGEVEAIPLDELE